jgi:signal transduction histidine kinase
MSQKSPWFNIVSKIRSLPGPPTPTKQRQLTEDERKGQIFIYFIGAIWILLAIDTVYQFYLAFAFQQQGSPDYQQFYTFAINDISFLIFFSLVWWGHRWYPRLMRHIFLGVIIVGAIFFFEVAILNRIFIVMALPIIMAAFLIGPFFSFFYFGLITATYYLRVYLAGISALDIEASPINFFVLFIVAMVSWLISRSLEKSLAETRALNRELDQRVQDRTRELAESLEREQALSIRNETILRSIADGIIVFDAYQQVLMANPAASKLARRNLNDLNQHQILDTIDETEAKESLSDWLTGNPPEKQSNIRFVWHKRTLSANVAPVVLPRESNKSIGAGHVMVLRDFTREAQLERAKDLFLGTVSHELRTPMSAIKGYVEVLLDLEQGTISAEGYGYLQTINISIIQLLTLANDLIDLSRLEAGEIELYCQWVDIETVIQDAVRMVQQEFNARNLELKIEIEPELPQLYVDGRRILQVLLNLLSNAYKYTVEGGATIRAYQVDNYVHIAVTDTGTGITTEDQANLFQRFFRANDQVVQQVGGTGLGLNISKGLTELHDGQLSFESQYGVGTTFTLSLPVGSAEPRPDVVQTPVEEMNV